MSIMGRLFLLSMFVVCIWSLQCNQTLANYLSPHSLGKQDEFKDALVNMCKQVRVNTTKYVRGNINCTLYNITIKCLYNDGKQQAAIISGDHIEIYGGFIEFQVYFNYTVARTGALTSGWGYASVLTTPINFTKEITLDSGSHPSWILAKADPIAIVAPLTIKRSEPVPTPDETAAISQALTNATSGITPKHIKQQILDLINQNYTALLNQTLREQAMRNKTIYQFNHPYKGTLAVNVTNELFYFNITPQNGFELFFQSLIDGWNQKDCTKNVPDTHSDYKTFGGIQTTISMDLIRHMAQKNIGSGWFNTVFTKQWETNAFQFFVDDLYELIPGTKNITPRTSLTGSCNVTEDQFFQVLRFSDNILQVNLNFSCNIVTNDTNKTVLSEFNVPTNVRVKITPQHEALEFWVSDVVGTPTFKLIPDYEVTDIKQAAFKISMALKSMVGYRVFGSGYPIWPRDLPEVWIHSDYILIYDSSQIPHQQQKTS